MKNSLLADHMTTLARIKRPDLNLLRWSPADNCYKLTIKPPDYAYAYTFKFATLKEAREKMEELKSKFGIETR